MTDVETIRSAAARLRSITIADQYAEAVHPERAFAMASVLDEAARHFRSLPDEVRAAVIDACQTIVRN